MRIVHSCSAPAQRAGPHMQQLLTEDVCTIQCPTPQSTTSTTCVCWVQVGDWGRMGNGNQRRTAQMMADVANCMPPAFVISTGDNFYESEQLGSWCLERWYPTM
jgi:hypothetical protein